MKDLPREMIDVIGWLKKQINELMPFKVKGVGYETTINKLERQIEKLNHKVKDSEILVETIKKIITDTENKIKSQKEYGEFRGKAFRYKRLCV